MCWAIPPWPEVARTISGGIVLTPTWSPGFSFSLDWYNLNMTGQIATVSQNLITNTCAVNINDPLCSALVFGGPNGALSIINRVPININATPDLGHGHLRPAMPRSCGTAR